MNFYKLNDEIIISEIPLTFGEEITPNTVTFTSCRR